MSATEKTVSALINGQLPEFVRADNPKFKRFVELYYNWLERDGSTAGYSYGNTVYHIMNAEKYRDIDETLDPFERLFKQELLPYFPENTTLDLTKILKGAREFYIKKGSEESVKWLFKVLFGEDIEIFLPKKQILIASDGKWKLPKAFDLTISEENVSINPNLLEKHMGIGSISKATCIIESANRTIDRTFGTEILEIYVSNVVGEFQNGENLEINYVDEYGVDHTFIEKIVGSLSGIKLDSNIKTDPEQKRRGLSYNVGDPVVVYGGLAETIRANDAVAIVGDVSVGSIEGVTPTFAGYGYRIYPSTKVTVYRSEGDDPAANQSTDIRLTAVTTVVNTTNSQLNFRETITVDKMPVGYLDEVQIGASAVHAEPGQGSTSTTYSVFTSNNRNIVISVTETDKDDIYFTNDFVWANGDSFANANFKAQILTANTSGFGQGGISNYGPAPILLYNVSNTQVLTATGFLVGQQLNTLTAPQKPFTINSITVQQLAANVDSTFDQVLNFESVETGGVALFNVINGGYGFRTTPTLGIDSQFDTYLSVGDPQYVQPITGFGQIAHVWINNPGSGYANGDVINLNGYGYGFSGYVNVNATGAIVHTTITNRGEGYFGDKTATVTSGSGTKAILTPYGFGEGATTEIETGAIGRIKEFKLISRGYDYISTPIVSLKVVDMVITAIDEAENLIEGERVYQGASLQTANFQGIVKNYNRTTRTLRLFNYSGASGAAFNATLPFVSEGGVEFSVDTSTKVIPPSAVLIDDPVLDPYRIVRSAGGLPNPWFYGNGRAKAVAEFFNGLIKFPGFYLNTDGFLSADKKTQDSKTYHNYSYVIESGQSLAEYRKSVMDIVHPSGMSMLGRTVSISDQTDPIIPTSTLYINYVNSYASTINVANSQLKIVKGVNTQFSSLSTANANDILIIVDTVNALRTQAKVITQVDSDTQLRVESDFCYVGQGKIETGMSNTVLVSGNTNSVSQFVIAGDMITFNVASGQHYVAQTGSVQIFTANGKVVGSGTAFTTQLAVNDYIKINNEVKQVVNIASSTVMNVNSSFSAALSAQTISKLATVFKSNVVSVSQRYINLEDNVNANTSNLVYKICPNYNSAYNYEIISTSNYANE